MMRKFVWFLPLLLLEAAACRAQRVPEKLKYELLESILNTLPRPFAYAKRGTDGKYHRLPPMATDTPTVRLLLLDHPYSSDDDYQVVLARDGTYERAQVLQYFSLADVAYMRQQLPASQTFKFEQSKIRQPGVTVLSLDTLTALNQRLGQRAHILMRDSLLQRYGSEQPFFVGGILFSKDHKRALVNVGGDGWETSVYSNTGTGWRREATLYVVEY
ncbi:hypothetical protein [Hymenobacter convexus]|uniref:hypothetical protein n=1 Tax=Hymenobacter sp. CA1UV-4 TaxID=3063782 RepID=UPI002712EC9A|nr:hypothetical protein [Hymenobacter sp. CA1UV-4]MDO7850143.1 hypothetical protein [Hymenobacter sp. CA1UV-4]